MSSTPSSVGACTCLDFILYISYCPHLWFLMHSSIRRHYFSFLVEHTVLRSVLVGGTLCPAGWGPPSNDKRALAFAHYQLVKWLVHEVYECQKTATMAKEGYSFQGAGVLLFELPETKQVLYNTSLKCQKEKMHCELPDCMVKQHCIWPLPQWAPKWHFWSSHSYAWCMQPLCLMQALHLSIADTATIYMHTYHVLYAHSTPPGLQQRKVSYSPPMQFIYHTIDTWPFYWPG